MSSPGMEICACEVAKRWPQSCQARLDMLVELDRRGLVKSTMKRQHGQGEERVWSSAREKVWRGAGYGP